MFVRIFLISFANMQVISKKTTILSKKISNNIEVDPASLVILSKAKYLCSAWL